MRKTLSILSFLAAVALLVGCLGPKPVELGNQAYHDGDYATALQQYQLGVDDGDADAMFAMGLLYSEGKGVSRNPARAVELLDAAARQGHADASTTLGIYYYYGINVAQDYTRAAGYFAEAVLLGDVIANDYLAHMLNNGLGVEKDPAFAADLQPFVTIR